MYDEPCDIQTLIILKNSKIKATIKGIKWHYEYAIWLKIPYLVA